MNYPLLTFGIIGLCIVALLGYFLRGALFSISSVASAHARVYAIAYIKGGALILIAACAAFEQAYWALDEAFRLSMIWAPYAIFFSKPLTGGLAVLVAFLDRSTQRATEDEAKEIERVRTGNTPQPFPAAPKP